MSNPIGPPRSDEPTRWQALAFAGKTWVFRAKRTIAEMARKPRRLPLEPIVDGAKILARSVAPLFSSTNDAEFALQAGKVQNLRVAAARLNGAVLRAGEVFGFWANVPRPSARRGFAPGRELREGCVIPSVGGGLCQLSNALYDAALTAGFEIVERHAHSRRLPGSMAEVGRDATVFWNYVDLRFRTTVDLQLEVRLTGTELVVVFRQIGSGAVSVSKSTVSNEPAPAGPEAESCETCGVTTCFRNPAAMALPRATETAWLLDAYWPEHDHYLASNRTPGDSMLVPLNGRRWGISPYRWGTRGCAKVVEFPGFTLKRSLLSRRLRSFGAARHRALLSMDA
jgi:hypothetical protein